MLLYDKGWSFEEIAEALLLTEDAIRHHINEYKSSKKLKPESGGSVEKISAEQSQKLEEHLRKYTYLYVKDIIAYIQSALGVSYTVPGMCSWLKRHGFAYIPKMIQKSVFRLRQSPGLNDRKRAHIDNMSAFTIVQPRELLRCPNFLKHFRYKMCLSRVFIRKACRSVVQR